MDEQTPTNKRVLTKTLITVAIILVLANAFFIYQTQRKEKLEQKSAPPQLKAGKQVNVPKGQLPEQFPADIPIEPKAIIYRNFNVVNAQGNFQATRMFTTAKTPTEELNFYKTTLPKINWQVVSTVTADKDGASWITGQQDQRLLSIKIYQNSQKKTMVDISVIIPQAK